MAADFAKVLLLGRLVSFMLVVYIGFGLVVEWGSRKPESKLKGFARLLCRPLVFPIARLAPADTPYVTILRRTAVAVVAVWLAFLLASEFVLQQN